MITFALGFLVAMVMMVVAGTLSTKYAIKRGWYASAIWSEKKKMWIVRGNYLTIAQRIHTGIKHEAVTGEKKVKYIH